MADDKNIIRLKFGMAGGANINGESGRHILKDLDGLTKAINGSGRAKLRFSLDVDGMLKDAQTASKKTTQAITDDSGKTVKAFSQIYKYMDKYGSKLERVGLASSFRSL